MLTPLPAAPVAAPAAGAGAEHAADPVAARNVTLVAYTGSPLKQSGTRLLPGGGSVGTTGSLGMGSFSGSAPDGGPAQRMAAITVAHTVGRGPAGGLTMTPLRVAGAAADADAAGGGGGSDARLESWPPRAGGGVRWGPAAPAGAAQGSGVAPSPGAAMDAALRAIGAAAAPADIPPPTVPRPPAAPRVPRLQLGAAAAPVPAAPPSSGSASPAGRATPRAPLSSSSHGGVPRGPMAIGEAPELDEAPGDAMDRFITTSARRIISCVPRCEVV